MGTDFPHSHLSRLSECVQKEIPLWTEEVAESAGRLSGIECCKVRLVRGKRRVFRMWK